MKIKATPVKAHDLKPGDLFSIAGPEYWDTYWSSLSIGERVYIRTSIPASLVDADTDVFRIEIIKEEQDA